MSMHRTDAIVLQQEVAPHVLLVTLNRPDKRNAMNVAMARALATIVKRVEEDRAVRVVVLTGAGNRAFCAGADLAEIAEGRGGEIAIGADGLGGMVFAERRKPWIAAVRGAALGGGLELALACDMIVAARDAVFGLPEVTRGLIAAAGGVYRLTHCLPRNLALEALATGESFSAADAHQYGMINRLVPDEGVVECAVQLASRIAGNPPMAVAESIRIARNAANCTETELRTMMDVAARRLWERGEARSGIDAFIGQGVPATSGSRRHGNGGSRKK